MIRPNKEALRLYRDILRATRMFTWTDDKGVPWRETLRWNARKEFEAGEWDLLLFYLAADRSHAWPRSEKRARPDGGDAAPRRGKGLPDAGTREVHTGLPAAHGTRLPEEVVTSTPADQSPTTLTTR